MTNIQKMVSAMTSKEIAEITGKEHPNVMRDIRKLIDEVGPLFKFEESFYLAGNNKNEVMYILEKESVQLLITGYSAIIRLKVIQRLNEVEALINNPVPVRQYSRVELAQQLLELEIENETKDKKIAELAPKAEFYDQVTGSNDTIDMGSVAKILNIKNVGRNTVFEQLRLSGILQANNQPYQKYVDNGWFRVIESKYTKPDGSTHISLKTVVYQKGLEGIRKVLSK